MTLGRPASLWKGALALLLLVVPLAARAGEAKEAKLPASPLGKLAAAYLELFDRGDRDALRDFIATSYSTAALQERSAEARAAMHTRIRSTAGAFAVFKVEQDDEYELRLWVRSQLTQEWFRLWFQREQQPLAPFRLSGIVIEPVNCPLPPLCRPRLSEAQMVAELGPYLDGLAAADLFSGVVLVARDGTPLFEKAYGASAWKTPNQASTRFGLASMGKMFTGVAVAQLAEQGRLSFQDPIRKYLPEHPRDITGRVTLHHLLTHTSGMASFLDARGLAEIQFLSLQDSLAVFFRRGLSFEPGERWQYSNAGYITLEAIVERVSRQPFPAYLEEHIYKPSGMRSTSDGFSTAEDLLRFSIALRGNKLLDRENTARVVTGRVQTTWGGARYGYGFADQKVRGQRIVGHAGAAPGWSGQLDIYWESGYTVVVLANREQGIAQRIAIRLRETMPGP